MLYVIAFLLLVLVIGWNGVFGLVELIWNAFLILAWVVCAFAWPVPVLAGTAGFAAIIFWFSFAIDKGWFKGEQ